MLIYIAGEIMYLDKHIHWSTLKNFVEPLKNELFVDNNFDLKKPDYNYLIRKNNTLLLEGLYDSNKALKTKLINQYSISYRSHKDGWKFEYSPIHFIYILFNNLGIDYRFPFYNLDNKNELEKCIKDVKNIISYEYSTLRKSYIDDGTNESKTIKETLLILYETYNNVDKIFEFRNYDIESLIINESKIHPKDFLFYIASRSLRVLNNVENPIYSVIPEKYANEIMEINSGTMYPNTPYPHTIRISNRIVNIDSFRDSYRNLKLTNKGLFIFKNNFKLSVKEFVGDFEIIKPGHIKREINEKNEMIKRMNRFEDPKYIKLFEAKSNFYDNSGFKYLIKGLYDLQGYFTYGYDNDNLISDRLFSSEQKGSILTKPEGFYVIPADRFDLLSKDKQTIRKAKETDNRIRNHNHDTDKGNKENPEYRWIKRAQGYIDAPSCSTRSIDEVIEEEESKRKIKAL